MTGIHTSKSVMSALFSVDVGAKLKRQCREGAAGNCKVIGVARYLVAFHYCPTGTPNALTSSTPGVPTSASLSPSSPFPLSPSPSSASSPWKPSSTTHFCGHFLRTSQEAPTTSKPGGRLPSSSTAALTCSRVVRITRWSGQEALSITAQGVEGGYGDVLRLTRLVMRSWSLCRAMRKTTV